MPAPSSFPKFTVTTTDGTEIAVPFGTRYGELLKRDEFPAHPEGLPFLAVKVNGAIQPLARRVDINCTMEPVYGDTKHGADVYRKSLSYIVPIAARRVFPGRRMIISHSLGHCYFFYFEDKVPLTTEQVEAMRNELKKIVAEDTPIDCKKVSQPEAQAYFKKHGMLQTLELLQQTNNSTVWVDQCMESLDIHHFPLVERTGLLSVHALEAHEYGFVMVYPSHHNPTVVPEFRANPLTFSIYDEYTNWGRILKVPSVGALNRITVNREVNDFVFMCETLQDKKVSNIAAQITADKRIVLIAGPSSSGKTTFSLKLSTHLRCKGLNPVTLCMDNYYVNRVNTPLDKDGGYDFEHVEAIDIPLFNEQLSALCRGEKVITPIFDFQTGTRQEGPAMQLEEGGIIVCEGIHGLNPRLSEQVAPEHKFKIFISPLTMLNIDDHHRISTTNNRLIRRIVRDNQFRGHSPEATINMWPSVGRGEEKWIFPHQYQADVYMNSALDYELGVLAGYVTPLLHAVPPTSTAYTKARTLLNFLSLVQTIPETAVPMHSILREFIGRSAFN